MLSKNKIKFIQSLNRKKVRDELGIFLVEGNKMVEEVIRSDYKIDLIACTADYAAQFKIQEDRCGELIITDNDLLAKASLLQNPQDALAIVQQPFYEFNQIDFNKELCLALDFIQDPGNLGTILRLADWFGIRHIICSENTVDLYNPKVVQASMGAIFRIKTHVTDLPSFLKPVAQNGIPLYGTFLEGKNIYQQPLSPSGIIILGNEGNGISQEVAQLVSQKLYIPDFSSHPNKPESLNVAIAASICCSEFRRRSMTMES
ncbi:MAG TPA: RNA methyltransferase [Prolixibacteraceae bacterium]|nr:RNA methyltransferase [Prolixibacteraceae bacterium]